MSAQRNAGELPRGELLGRYRSYEDAQKVVDHLTQAEGFDIKAISIVGNDLRSVEYIRSRLSYPRVAGAGAAQGAMFGFFIGLLIFLFAPEAPVLNLLMSVVLGMAIWMIMGVVGYAIRRGQRDFSSSTQMVATTYDVVCDFSHAGRARALVAGAGVQSLNAWNDPTGKTTALGGAAPMRSHPGASSGPEAAVVDPAARPSSVPGAAYASLPDGRPRYGVRREDVESANQSQQRAPEPEGAESAEPASSPDKDAKTAQGAAEEGAADAGTQRRGRDAQGPEGADGEPR
ncbi:general stress protein [Nesterenkonia massiliensis]|uniref:general stress protein n=1 Tax=Nesterenkonia massiliensis TaxID=1232429 RepID=UPI0004174366|nr:general stress protein [Nesterenkonia massiliensis]